MRKSRKYPNLTKTEAKVLELIVSGKPNKEIAAMLHRSIRTVEGYRYRIMHKFGAANIAELIKKVLVSKPDRLKEMQKKASEFKSRIIGKSGRVAQLTNIEKTMLGLILDGETNREISSRLNRALRTVEEHRRRIMTKMGADNIIGLVKSSMQMGLVKIGNRKSLKRKCLQTEYIRKKQNA